jgi:hypothetical protein
MEPFVLNIKYISRGSTLRQNPAAELTKVKGGTQPNLTGHNRIRIEDISSKVVRRPMGPTIDKTK